MTDEPEETTYRLALRQALRDEMAADDSVVLLGEDVAAAGGVFKVTEGLLAEFGPRRVWDTPISESAIVGAALGAALNGLRPIVDLMFADFVGVAMDQLMNQVAKYRYMTGGRVSIPMVVRSASGAGFSFGAQHSTCPESLFMHTPGWRVVAPSTPSDAYSLLRAAIRSEDPVMFFEHKYLYGSKGILEQDESCELGRGIVRRAGSDVTVVGTAMMSHRAIEAAESLAADRGFSVEVVDLRTLAPLDLGLVVDSVRKTGRLITVEESPRECGWGSELVSSVTEHLLSELKSVRRVTGPSTPIPASPPLESAWLPQAADVVDAVTAMLDG